MQWCSLHHVGSSPEAAKNNPALMSQISEKVGSMLKQMMNIDLRSMVLTENGLEIVRNKCCGLAIERLVQSIYFTFALWFFRCAFQRSQCRTGFHPFQAAQFILEPAQFPAAQF